MPARLALRPAAGVVPISTDLASNAGLLNGEAITIAPLPELPEPPAGSGWTAVLPALGAVGMSAYALLSGRLLVILLSIAGSGAAVIVAVATRRASVRRWRATCAGRRDRYLDHLDACASRARAAAHRQRVRLCEQWPAPGTGAGGVADTAVGTVGSPLPARGRPGWEVRLGVGRVPLQPQLQPPTPPHPSSQPWPELAAALADLVAEAATVEDCPVTLDLAAAGPLGVIGSVSDGLALGRALQLQLPELRVLGAPSSDASVASIVDGPAVVLAESVDQLPAGVCTLAVWRPDGSLTLRPAMSTVGGAALQLVARPDRVSDADAERLGLQLARIPASDPTKPSRALPFLGVSLGLDEAGDPIVLDLAESAHGGDGPHGWIVGATGTGKSQLLRRLVAGLAAERSPTEVAFVLVDFKGGAAFDDLAALPHVAGVLTNLDDARDQGDVQRLIAALHAEIRRRQQALRTAAVADLTAYRAQPGKADLPHLVVVVDEAAELLGSCPEMLDTFATLGRVGRSLGIHLVLASQRPDEARLRSLEGALRFRICLRTLTAADSIAVVRDPGAADLPAEPGWALLAVDGPPTRLRVLPVHAAPALESVAPTRPVWHPPLPAVTSLPLPKPADPAESPPTVLLGLADAPQAQWRGPLSIALDGAAGHLAIVGAPRTGRSSALRAVAVSLAAALPPARAHVYAVSAEPALTGLNVLPHTGAVAHPADADLALDVIATVATLVADRQRSAGDGVRPLRRPADVVLLLDDWPQLRVALPDLEAAVQEIAANGLGVGVHLVLTAHRWSDLRGGLRDCFGARLELYLPDPLESLLPRHLVGPPAGVPGRGVLLAGQLPGSTALPLPLDLQLALPQPDAEDAVQRRWSTQTASVRQIRPLPSLAIRPVAAASPAGALGVGTGGPVSIDLDRTDRHLLVVGDPGSGRTTVLAAVARALAEADCWLIDPRGSLPPHFEPQQGAHTPRQIEGLLSELHAQLLATLNGDQPKRRRLLLIDDLDIAATLTSPAGWAGIAALLPVSADLGLTVAVARRCAGMARTAYEPFLGALRDAGATGVLLAGSPDEGPIVGGVRCRPGAVGRALLVRPGRPAVPLQLYAEPPQLSRQVSGL